MSSLANDVHELLMKLPRRILIDVMDEALSLMQGYNGRDKTYCVAEALGYEADEAKGTYKLPTVYHIMKEREG